MSIQLQDFEKFQFTNRCETRTVYRKGHGPAVFAMHVLPGMIPEFIDFARRVTDSGFTVYLPHMFGQPGRQLSGTYLANQFMRVCLRREFYALAAHKSSPLCQEESLALPASQAS